MKNRAFTIIELLVSVVIMALLGGIGMISYNNIFNRVDENYYQSLEKTLLMAGNDYFASNRKDLPISNYKVVTIADLVDKGYSETLKDTKGNICRTGNVYVYHESGNNFNYYVCLECGDYKTNDIHCDMQSLKGVIVISGEEENGNTYNPTLSYDNVLYASGDVSITMQYHSDGDNSVNSFIIENTKNHSKITCQANNNQCVKTITSSGSYRVSALDDEGKKVCEDNTFNVKIDREAPRFNINAQKRYLITDGTSLKNVIIKLINVSDDNGIRKIEYRYSNSNDFTNLGNSQTINSSLTSGSYHLEVKVIDVANKEVSKSVDFDVSYNVKLKYPDNTLDDFEVIKGKTYGYLSNLPRIYQKRSIEWKYEGIVYNDEREVVLGQEHILVASYTDYVRFIDEDYYCLNPTYTGQEQILTREAPTGVSFTNNYGTEIRSYSVTVSLNDDNLKWEDGTTSSKTITCYILPKNLPPATLDNDSYVYDGSAKEPTITIADNGYTLVEGTDYTLIYQDNTNVGRGTVVITGIGIYQGSDEKHFTITKAESVITCNNPTYSGENIQLGTCAGGEISDNTGINASNYNLTCVGDSNHNDSEKTCSILANQLPPATLSDNEYTYDGNAKEPKVNMVDGSYTLVRDVDYTSQYINNTEVGTATVTITGIGNYQGEQELEFIINSACVKKETGSIYLYGTGTTSINYSFNDSDGTPNNSSIEATATNGSISCTATNQTINCSITGMTTSNLNGSAATNMLKTLLADKFNISKNKVFLNSYSETNYSDNQALNRVEYVLKGTKYYARKTTYSSESDAQKYQGPNSSGNANDWRCATADGNPISYKDKVNRVVDAYHCYDADTNENTVSHGKLFHSSSLATCKCFPNTGYYTTTQYYETTITVNYCVE